MQNSSRYREKEAPGKIFDRNFVIAVIIAAGGLLVFGISMPFVASQGSAITPSTPSSQQNIPAEPRVVTSTISTDQITSLVAVYGLAGQLNVPPEAGASAFVPLNIDDVTLAQKLGLPSVVMKNGTRNIILLPNAQDLWNNGMGGASIAFYYNGKWYSRPWIVPNGVTYYQDVAATLAWIKVNAS